MGWVSRTHENKYYHRRYLRSEHDRRDVLDLMGWRHIHEQDEEFDS